MREPSVVSRWFCAAACVGLVACGSDSIAGIPVPATDAGAGGMLGTGGAGGSSSTPGPTLDPACPGQVLGSLLNGGDATFAKPEIAIDPRDGFPVVTWQEDVPSGGVRVFVKKWDGARWLALGGALGTEAVDDDARSVIAVSASGVITVAWLEFSSLGDTLHAAQWDPGAQSWLELAALSDVFVNTGFETETLALTIGADESPLLALSEYVQSSPTNYWIALYRLEGSSWQAVTERCCESSEAVDLAISAGRASEEVAIVRSLADGSAASAINLYTLGAGTLNYRTDQLSAERAPSSQSYGRASHASLAHGADGRILASYYSGAEVFVASWTEASEGWTLLGPTLGESAALHPRLALDTARDTPLVSLQGRVVEWDRASWATRCEGLAFSGDSQWLSLAVNADGAAFVVMRGEFRENPLYVVRLSAR
jgi:hypothetical protein